MLPGLPWHWPEGTRRATAAGALGADTEDVLTRVAGLDGREIEALRARGALA